MPFEAFQAAAQRAADLVRSKPKGTRWFLACDTDADGLCAAAVTASALAKAGQRFTIRASRDKTGAAYRDLFHQDCDALIFLDKGTSHIDLLGTQAKETGRPVIVLDHHNLAGPTPDTVVLVNPRAAGLDGSRDASAATTAVAFALALNGAAGLSTAPIGLSGAIGDWQHVPDWKGWNLHLLEQATASEFVAAPLQPRFIGVTLAAALTHFRPPIPGLHGDLAAATAFLQSLDISPEIEAEELQPEPATRLISACTLRYAGAGQAAEAKNLVGPTTMNVRLNMGLRHVYRIVDACGREGHAATGIAFLLGDKTAKAEAMTIFARYKATLHAGLKALVAKGTEMRSSVQVAWTENPDYTGMVAGLGMEHILKDRTRPVAVLSKRSDGQIQISTRGQEALVKKGLDLGAACLVAAKVVGAEGGGHPVAAGAVVASDRVEEFLVALDAALSKQPFRSEA